MSVLQISELKKSYLSPEGESSLIIDVASFALEPGEQVALRGESGSGKTTFLNLISGISKADSGRIVVSGSEMTSMTEPERDALRALKIGYIFQTFNLLQGYTAIENVMLGMMFGGGTDGGKAISLLNRVGLHERLNYLPSQLSIGQQQRVSVARALASGPDIVLADEPTGNLDPKMSSEAVDLIKEVCRENNAALLFVSHDETALSEFEKVMELSDINLALSS